MQIDIKLFLFRGILPVFSILFQIFLSGIVGSYLFVVKDKSIQFYCCLNTKAKRLRYVEYVYALFPRSKSIWLSCFIIIARELLNFSFKLQFLLMYDVWQVIHVHKLNNRYSYWFRSLCNGCVNFETKSIYEWPLRNVNLGSYSLLSQYLH